MVESWGRLGGGGGAHSQGEGVGEASSLIQHMQILLKWQVKAKPNLEKSTSYLQKEFFLARKLHS